MVTVSNSVSILYESRGIRYIRQITPKNPWNSCIRSVVGKFLDRNKDRKKDKKKVRKIDRKKDKRG